MSDNRNAVDSPNPYASTIYSNHDSYVEPSAEMAIAGQGQRFLTMLIDQFVLYGINFLFGIVVGIVSVAMSEGDLSQDAAAQLNLFLALLGVFVSVFYYIVMEATTSKTVGKMVMGTKVVGTDGGRPSLGQIVGRSFCRLIPFEPLSFFGNRGYPIGWHDRLPGTRVISTRRKR